MSVPSSEAATLPDETPRVDEPEGPIGGEAAPGQPGAVTPGYAPASPPAPPRLFVGLRRALFPLEAIPGCTCPCSTPPPAPWPALLLRSGRSRQRGRGGCPSVSCCGGWGRIRRPSGYRTQPVAPCPCRSRPSLLPSSKLMGTSTRRCKRRWLRPLLAKRRRRSSCAPQTPSA